MLCNILSFCLVSREARKPPLKMPYSCLQSCAEMDLRFWLPVAKLISPWIRSIIYSHSFKYGLLVCVAWSQCLFTYWCIAHLKWIFHSYWIWVLRSDMIFLRCLFRQASLILMHAYAYDAFIHTAVFALEVTRWILLVVVGVSAATVDALMLLVACVTGLGFWNMINNELYWLLK